MNNAKTPYKSKLHQLVLSEDWGVTLSEQEEIPSDWVL